MAVQRNPARPGPVANRPDAAQFLADALAGLRHSQKVLPCKYLYDAAGSALFDAICETPEYYPTRTELAIMRAHADEMGARLGPGCQVVEYGSGSGVKTRLLLRHLPRPAAYVPVDISVDHLHRSAKELAARFPEVEVQPVAADFTRPFEVPDPAVATRRRVVYFPGSTIGNFGPAEALTLLTGIAGLSGPGGALLIGVDLKKEPEILNAAYNDAAGVTAAFNRNLLARMNRELGADFDLSAFRHRAFYNEAAGRVEMHLDSTRDQIVRLGGQAIRFAAGESIHTENSYKYAPNEFEQLASRAGLRLVTFWTDPRRLFSVQLYEVSDSNCGPAVTSD
ncbi:MAG TPA: L-histidine N(alpha)-methyltransferase [Fimbriiglobus sp.]|jgi:dimethylhistidine N-methyltransferase|nr:L-histidine N(alpha)-methyltransferase [Fimbriiglobus sp.]